MGNPAARPVDANVTGMRLALLLLALAACSSTGGSSEPIHLDGPQAYGVPADAGPVTEHAVLGGTVWQYRESLYGPCELLEPHEDDLAGWLGIPPPDGYGDFGMVCRH